MTSPYRKVRRIAIGGMASVYEGRDDSLDRSVAIKEPHLDSGCSGTGEDRFLQEARKLARVRHANVVEVFAVETERRRSRMIMELADGALAEKIRSGPLGSIDEVVDVFGQLVSGLAEIHVNDLVHRDIKPQNILRFGKQYKICDFGIAKRLDDRSQPYFTQKYSAPELHRGQTTSASSDVYSLGLVGYEMILGSHEFEQQALSSWRRAIQAKGKSAEIEWERDTVSWSAWHMADDVALDSLVGLDGVSEPLACILDRMVAKSLGDRYVSGVAVRDALLRLRGKRSIGGAILEKNQYTDLVPEPATTKATSGLFAVGKRRGLRTSERSRRVRWALAGITLAGVGALLLAVDHSKGVGSASFPANKLDSQGSLPAVLEAPVSEQGGPTSINQAGSSGNPVSNESPQTGPSDNDSERREAVEQVSQPRMRRAAVEPLAESLDTVRRSPAMPSKEPTPTEEREAPAMAQYREDDSGRVGLKSSTEHHRAPELPSQQAPRRLVAVLDTGQSVPQDTYMPRSDPSRASPSLSATRSDEGEVGRSSSHTAKPIAVRQDRGGENEHNWLIGLPSQDMGAASGSQATAAPELRNTEHELQAAGQKQANSVGFAPGSGKPLLISHVFCARSQQTSYGFAFEELAWIPENDRKSGDGPWPVVRFHEVLPRTVVLDFGARLPKAAVQCQPTEMVRRIERDGKALIVELSGPKLVPALARDQRKLLIYDPEALRHEAVALLTRGRFGKVRGFIAEAREIGMTFDDIAQIDEVAHLGLRRQAGLRALEDGDFAGTIERLQPVAARYPEDFEVQVGLARAYYQHSDYGRASEMLEALRKRNPRHGEVLFQLGLVEMSRGREDLAVGTDADLKDRGKRILALLVERHSDEDLGLR